MSKPTFINSSVVYHDYSTEYHIDARGNDLASVLRACDANEVEDIQPIQEEKSKPKGICPCITKAAHDAGKAQDVDSELRSASTSAPKLVKAITTNEALGYVDTKNMTSEDLYNLLNEYYNLPFKARCFRYYRSK